MDDLETLREQVETARAESARLAERLADREARAAELESTAAGLRRSLETAHTERLAALGRYRETLLAAAPELPAELITGESLEQIDEAVRRARELVARVRAHPAPDAARPIPAGSPPRRPPDLSAMSAAEKIRHGIGERR